MENLNYSVRSRSSTTTTTTNYDASLMKPMSPLAASATVINLILATGPFTYPYGYTQLGPVISAPLLFIMCFLSYITSSYVVEAIAIVQA